MNTVITIKPARFENEKRMAIFMPNQPKLIDLIKQIEGRRWSPTLGCWHFPNQMTQWQAFQKLFQSFDLNVQKNVQPLIIPYSDMVKRPQLQLLNNSKQEIQVQNLTSNIQAPPQYQSEINRFEEKMTLKRLSISTIKLYKSCFAQFLFFYNDKHPQDITHDEIIKYMIHRIKVDKISIGVQNNFINAIKCYYEFVLDRERTYYDLQRPKRPIQLPNVLSQEEAVKLFDAVSNIKHKCILITIYSAGLRISEVVNLRLSDIRRTDNSIFIKAGKGKKDRYTMLSQTLIAYLDNYFKDYQPAYWLFEGQTGGQYSVRSVQNILRDAVAKSGVNPYATVHTLRHSFATHLVLSGLDIITLQKLLGHESPVTTEIYIHLSKQHIKQIQSPLDKLIF